MLSGMKVKIKTTTSDNDPIEKPKDKESIVGSSVKLLTIHFELRIRDDMECYHYDIDILPKMLSDKRSFQSVRWWKIQIGQSKRLRWVCSCRSKWVPGTDISLTSSGIFFRVSSFVFNLFSVLFRSDTFAKKEFTPTRYPRSEFALTLIASRPEDAFIDLTANSTLGLKILSIAVKIAFWILSSTVSAMFPISLSTLSKKNLSNVCTLSKFSLVVNLLP